MRGINTEVKNLKAGDRIDFIHCSKPIRIDTVEPGDDGKIEVTFAGGHTRRYHPDAVVVKAQEQKA